ncbi:MAG: flagellar filament capping protein FliD [Candidatus Syntrophopropionicum ammoniitolerans]
MNITAGEGQEGSELLANLFSALRLNSLEPDTPLHAHGRDAEIVYDGLHLNQSCNQFTISGVSYTLTGTSDTEVVNISLTNDTDAVFDAIKSFVELYNTTIEQINTKLGEVKNRDYLPLTDDQREELSEKQQEKWEDKARIGLLRNDSILDGVINDMRRTLSSLVEGTDATCRSLADIGITTGAWYERGKLYINEDQLKEALTANPQGVMDLFTRTSEVNSEKGLATRIYDNLTTRISQIIDKAGSNDSVLGKRIADYDKQIVLWDNKLQDMEQRYYKQYAALETALARMNQQSLSLMSLFGQGNWG